ncbi:ferredoxin family protein [Shimia sp.]|uniref:ferredoxin family protein n=1 Tax=Shimia sp. TaxID=1954381 RepID=UPI00329A2973
MEVCPADWFYEGENMIVINTEECIYCAVREPECPVDAIKPDTIPDAAKWIALNQKYAEIWPNISEKGARPSDADSWPDTPDNLAQLSENPAQH